MLPRDKSSLVISDVEPEDKGLYTCVASNSAGTRKSIAAQLTVQGFIASLFLL